MSDIERRVADRRRMPDRRDTPGQPPQGVERRVLVARRQDGTDRRVMAAAE